MPVSPVAPSARPSAADTLWQGLSEAPATASFKQQATAAWSALEHQQTLDAGERQRLQARCAAAVLTDYFVAWSDFRGLSDWQARWAATAEPSPGQPVQQWQHCIGALCAQRLADVGGGGDDALNTGLNQAMQLLRNPDHALPLAACLLGAPVLLECCQVLRRASIAQELEWHFTRHVHWADAPPYWCARLFDSLSAAYYVLDQRTDAERCEAQALALAEQHGLDSLRFELLKRPVRLALEDARLADAQHGLTQMAQTLDPQHLGHAVEYWDLQGRWLLASQHPSAAADALRRADELAATGELPLQRRIVLWSMQGAAQLALNNPAATEAALQQALAATSGHQAHILGASLCTAQAWFAAERGAPDAQAQLQHSFQTLAALNLVRFLRPLPQQAAQLCLHGLQAGCDRTFILRVIQERRLPRPATAGACWPSPVQVFCLGAGEWHGPTAAAAGGRGKTPAKALEILWLLGAQDGDAVPVHLLLSTLWPEADAASARAAFDMALARLRRLLGDEGWLQLDNGVLRADPQALWFDTTQQRELVQQLTRPGQTPTQALRLARQLVVAWRGDFVGRLPAQPWVLAARERQRARCARGVRAAADLLLAAGDTTAAEQLLLAATEALPTSEALCQALMALYLQRSDQPQALQALQRLDWALQSADLPPPSARTRALVGR